MTKLLEVLKLFADTQIINKLSDKKNEFLSVKQIAVKLKEDNFLYVDQLLCSLYHEEMLERDVTSLVQYKLSQNGIDLLIKLKDVTTE